MSVIDPASYTHRYVTVYSGNRYHLIDEMPKGFVGPAAQAPTILALHGFPDLWYGWRYQIRALASRGFRVIVPSQLGYWDTSKPDDVRKYSYKSVAYDMNSLLNELGVIGQVTVLAHDWGGATAWRLADYFPHRVKAIASVCTPYPIPARPGQPLISDEELIDTVLPNFGYQLFFAKETTPPIMDEVAEFFLQPMFSSTFRQDSEKRKNAVGGSSNEWVKKGRLEASVHRMLEGKRAGTLQAPAPEPEFDVYLHGFKKSGFRGPLSWYKTRAINFREEQEAKLPPFPAQIPALHIVATDDAALPAEMARHPSIKKRFPGGNLEIQEVKGDHWLLQDPAVRDHVTSILLEFVERNNKLSTTSAISKL